MRTNDIRQVNIEDLQQAKAVRTILKDGYMIASHDGYIDRQTLALFASSVRITAVYFVLCREGNIDVTFNMKKYLLKAKSLVIGIPDIIVQVKADSPVGVNALFLKKDFLDELHLNVDHSLIQILLYILNNPVLSLSDEEFNDLYRLSEGVGKLASQEKEDVYAKEILRSVIRALIYKICQIVSLRIGQDNPATSNPSKYEYFRQFFQLLSTEYVRHRNVNWYADQLHLSTKYFTSVIRQISGRTTIDWINDRVIFEAKHLLLHSDMSVSEIAYHLNFPNPSFFSKYFKNIVGINPSEFRKMSF